MANNQNLHPALSTSEARELGRRGGIASGASRRRRRAFCRILQEIGDLPASKASELSENFPGLASTDITNLTSLALALYTKAQEGDTKAIQTILFYTSQDRTVDSLDLLPPEMNNPFNIME